MKKLLLGILFFMVCQTGVFAVEQGGLLTASYNPKDASVTVSLTAANGAKAGATIVVYRCQGDNTDIGIDTQFFCIFESDTDGTGNLRESFEFTEDMKSGKYTVSVTVGSRALYDDFYYVNRAETQTPLGELEKGRSLRDVVTDYHDALGVDMVKYSAKSSLIDSYYHKFLNHDALTFENFYKAYMSAEIAAFCNNDAQKNVLERYLQKYPEVLGIDYQLYERLSGELKNDVLLKLCRAVYFAGSFSAEYNQTIVLSDLDYAKKGVWTEYANLLMNVYNDILSLDLADYLKLKNKELVIKKLMSSSFSTFGALRDAFYTEVEKQLTSGGAYTPSSSPGGGKSGRVTSSAGFSGEPAAVVQSPVFLDVGFDHWCYREIKFMKDNHILDGDGTGKFYPDTPMTRAEFCKIIAKAFQIADAENKVAFNDVSENGWFSQYVGALSSNRLIIGNGDNLFLPDEKITRQDMCVIISRVLTFKNIHLTESDGYVSFTDAAQISGYAAEAVSQLIRYGVINGNEQGELLPLHFLTKAECAKVVYNIMEKGGILR